MGLSDMFRPKWESSDYKVRLKAVKGLTDQNILAAIAKKDSNGQVISEAVNRLTDPGLLIDIAENAFYSDARKAALNRIPDQGIVADYIIRHEYGYTDMQMSLFALNRITDAHLLIHIADKCSSRIKSDVLRRIKDHRLLAEYVRNSGLFENPATGLYDVKIELLGIIKDQGMIAAVARNNANINIRKAAVDAITDQKDLYDLAANDRDGYIRKSAFERITEQKLLNDLAYNAKDMEIRQAAQAKGKISCTHEWNKCKCSICGAVRDSGHETEKCRCTVCGRTFHELDAKCVCKKCGETCHDFDHYFFDHNEIEAWKCRKCGYYKDSYYCVEGK